MSWRDYLLLLLGMGAVTYLPRYLPLAVLADRPLPAWFRHWLGYVPPAILAALVAQELVPSGDGATPAQGLLAALPTLLVAWRFRSLGGGVLAGMASYWLLGHLL